MAVQKFPYQDESVFHGTSFHLLSDLFLGDNGDSVE